MASLFLITVLLLAGADGMTTGEVAVVAQGFQFTEGPLWMPGEGLVFSDIPADTIYRADKSVFRHPSGQSNGLTLDNDGRLIAAEHQTRRVTRTGKDGAITVLAERFEGKRLNSPNDVVVRSDGTIFFTDPSYGLKGGLGGPEAELGFCGVYAIAPKGELMLLTKDFKKPNGLALSPDEKTLYVADTEGAHIRAFDVAADGRLDKDRVFFDLPGPDGMKVDVKGNVWATGGGGKDKAGVYVIDPAGRLLERIAFPEAPANCAFGDADFKTLYVTARKGLYKVRTVVDGVRPGARRAAAPPK